jgi:phytoene dehydrogenase-like protein
MSEPERFEFLMLGSGQGGKLLAWHLARAGRRTAVVERRWIGGLLSQHRLPTQQERDLERQLGSSAWVCSFHCLPLVSLLLIRQEHGSR